MDLLFLPPAGLADGLDMQAGGSLRTLVGHSHQLVALPELYWAQITATYAVDDSGTISLYYSPFAGLVSTATVNGGDPSEQAAEMQLGDLSASLMLSDRGVILSGSFQKSISDPTTTPLTNELSQEITQLSVPLPHAPVGVGARWRTTVALPLSQSSARLTYTLRALHGSQIQLDFSITEIGKPGSQRLASDHRDGVSVVRYTGTGTGSEQLDLRHVLPSSLRVDRQESTTLRVTRGHSRQDVTLSLQLNERGTALALPPMG